MAKERTFAISDNFCHMSEDFPQSNKECKLERISKSSEALNNDQSQWSQPAETGRQLGTPYVRFE
ncbi:hypothetical protein BATDEDRAFT_85782 [Batrachochytrium dendrobatidis JAM81]|uniref:Uncharacterized protein n=1 Tax=Batrachochytrium dendrobatidis (strain JAM81 / FGSC 10211) TaxID=684364 RepID=F4NU29_BATDJ|nr:uncharacterized protein BATDEDRAFT_85782 [Batrachochytrium dendrobatidis JAM81]EGF83158.1 hypothetical protein BATDEDRAFT_85782 [Batrachochytrium dendrobatidis JAM81]KAJ8325792.1 hypothetical protein O5D80_005982 [Batrachochytrium dendrobatidis]KAK5671678.1 hypothetical protein QVD99_001517 [Batrachochytrium dendrobatidis]|eukprot:XP_006675997.1 hypothetical protein BATDEDRAFT_85782 [Batrachochytrium dendrobatidis JAM81]